MWHKVLSLQPDLPEQPQEKLEDTSLDNQVSSLQSPGCSILPAPAFQLLLRGDVFSRNKSTASCSLRPHLDEEMNVSCGCLGTERALLNSPPSPSAGHIWC